MINLSRYRRKRTEIKRKGGSFWKPKDGERTVIRLFSFKHVVSDLDVKLRRYNPKVDGVKVGDTVEELDVSCPTHFLGGNAGASVCEASAGNPCVHCDEAEALQDEQEARQRRCRYQNIINVFPVDDAEGKMSTWSSPPSAYERILGYVTDDEYTGLLGCKGRDFIVDYDSTRKPSEQYQIRLRDADKSKELPSVLEKQVKDLMVLKDFIPESLHPMLEGKAEEKPSEASGEAEEPPADPKPKASKPKPSKAPEAAKKPPPEAEPSVDDLEDDDPAPKDAAPDLSRMVGKDIEFDGEGKVVKGKVIGVENGKLIVETADGEWEVDPGLVQRVIEAPKASVRKKTS